MDSQGLSARIDQAQARIEEAVAQFDLVALQLSGGKDSLACLQLARPWWDRIHVVWANAGDTVPETRAQMDAIKAMVPHFHEVQGQAVQTQQTAGWPVDMVPAGSSPLGRMLDPDQEHPALVGRYECCAHNVWLPMHKALAAAGVKALIRGQRDDERLRNSAYRHGSIVREINASIVLPIQEWTALQVFEYLKREDVPIPAQYAYGLTSLDCLHCTAYMHEREPLLRYLRDHHTAAAAEVERRLKVIDQAQDRERRYLRAAIGANDLDEPSPDTAVVQRWHAVMLDLAGIRSS
ncbi:MAG: phosphoadenosine phosphosulfate reductase family protein [Paucibacter sp.]|nr:phosphoadenosine phosphosulfate reductase family protein [Roseateles sp.]